VCIYSRALSDADIVQLYNQTTVSAVAGSSPPFTLGHSVPNPMSADSRVEFTLATAQNLQLDVFDVAWHRVRRLESGVREAGPHVAMWDGRLDDGKEAPSGVYFFRLKASGSMLTTRFVRVR
jgi:hypothetical protein